MFFKYSLVFLSAVSDGIHERWLSSYFIFLMCSISRSSTYFTFADWSFTILATFSSIYLSILRVNSSMVSLISFYMLNGTISIFVEGTEEFGAVLFPFAPPLFSLNYYSCILVLIKYCYCIAYYGGQISLSKTKTKMQIFANPIK